MATTTAFTGYLSRAKCGSAFHFPGTEIRGERLMLRDVKALNYQVDLPNEPIATLRRNRSNIISPQIRVVRTRRLAGWW